MPEFTSKTYIEMKEQWYTSKGSDKKRTEDFQKKYKTGRKTTEKLKKFFNPRSGYSNYRK